MSDRLKQIKRRLREIKRDPGSAAPGEAQRLHGEYRRLQSADRAPAADQPEPEPERTLSRPVVPLRGMGGWTDKEVADLPVELRNRMRDRALTRQILPWRD